MPTAERQRSASKATHESFYSKAVTSTACPAKTPLISALYDERYVNMPLDPVRPSMASNQLDRPNGWFTAYHSKTKMVSVSVAV